MTYDGDLRKLIHDVPDFPQAGVGFKDITPILSSPEAFAAAIEGLVAAGPDDVDVVCAMEARGFIVGAPVALALGAAFVPVRKQGKLPRETVETAYDLEYGSQVLAMHADAISSGNRVLVVDDVLATGGTVAATADLVRRLGGEVVAVSVLMELAFLRPRELLSARGLDDVHTLVTFGS